MDLLKAHPEAAAGSESLQYNAHVISLFIPVYNAAKLSKRIRENIKRFYDVLIGLNRQFEIIFVDDHSTDKSYRFKRIVKNGIYPEGRSIRYVSYEQGPSRRENLAQSFFQAKGEILAYMDADFSCDIFYLLKAISLLEESGADMVIGSRYIRGAKVKREIIRRILSFFYNGFVRLLFHSVIKDHQCGLKVFRRGSVLPIIREMGYDQQFIRGWFWDAELLIRAQRAGLKIIEMPVEWHYADSSTFDFYRELRCLKAIIELKKKLRVTPQ